MRITINYKREPHIRTKSERQPRMKITIRENRIGEDNELNGYFIYCRTKGKVCESWWSGPSDCFGDVDYLQRHGYHNIKTHKDYVLFSQITRVALANIKKIKKSYVFYNPRSGKYIFDIIPWGSNKLSGRTISHYSPEQIMNAVNNNHVDMRHWTIKEVIK